MRAQLKFYLVPVIILLFSMQCIAQMERERANIVEPVETFWTPTLISQATTEHLSAGNLNVTIMHSFGIATTNTIQNFFGLDNVHKRLSGRLRQKRVSVPPGKAHSLAPRRSGRH